MNHTNFLICASYLLLASLLVEGFLGINWGRMATQRMIPSMVVDMLLQNNITEVKLFSYSVNVLEAFGGTNINLAITMSNGEIKYMNKSEYISNWIYKNIRPHLDMDVSVKYVYVGIQPLSTKFRNTTYNSSVSVMGWMQKAFDSNENYTGLKATISHYSDILDLTTSTKPSMVEFRTDLKELLFNQCRTLKDSKAPFGIEIQPLLSVQEHFNNDTEFAFFENNSTTKFTDGKFTYSNVFEVIYDSVVCALEKLGFPDIPVAVGGIGWPTDGIEHANLQNAERFHQGLAKFIQSQKGTPRRPGNISAYIHNIADENAVGASADPSARHWGIYKFDGQPKFNLDFQGYERKILPVSAIGITHMPKRWCILDNSKVNSNQIPFKILDQYYDNSCKKADCTAMAPGGSCSSLQFPLNYSYGFNMVFQAESQKVQGNSSCDYGGYGVIVADDPSTPNCTFPIEIIAAETTNFLGQGRSQALAVRPSSVSITAIVQFLFILFTLTCAR